MPQKQSLTVRALIVNENGEIFVARRAMTKRFFPGMLELPGGYVEFGETYPEAIRRELREELQTDTEVLQLHMVHTSVVEDNHFGEVYYIIPANSLTATPIISEDNHTEILWLTRDSFQQWDASHPDYLAIEEYFEKRRG